MKTYLVICENSGLVKIGKGSDPVKRLSTMQVGSTSKLSIAHVFDKDIEKKLHTHFKDNREMGEWFSIRVEDAIEVGLTMTGVTKTKNKNELSVINGTDKKSVFNTIHEKSISSEKYPFSTLKIGESFSLPNSRVVQSIRSLAYQRGETLGRKFRVSALTLTVTRIK